MPLEVQHGFTVVQANDPPNANSDNCSTSRREPYIALAFLVEDKILWMTDVSAIPEKTWNVLHYGLDPDHTDSETKRSQRRLPVAFIDLSDIDPRGAHLSVRTFLEVVEKLDAKRSYAIGINHTLCHGEIEALGEEVEGTREEGKEDAFLIRVLRDGKKVGDAPAWSRLKQRKLWIRPCHDGMAVRIEGA